MPMGPSIGGFAYFAGTKFLGYSAFAHVLRKKFDDNEGDLGRTFKIGGIRTLIGIGVGISYGALMSLAAEAVKSEWIGYALFFGGLLPVRLGEWYWLLQIAFKEKVRSSADRADPGPWHACLLWLGCDRGSRRFCSARRYVGLLIRLTPTAYPVLPIVRLPRYR